MSSKRNSGGQPLLEETVITPQEQNKQKKADTISAVEEQAGPVRAIKQKAESVSPPKTKSNF
jgi:hypothetical protein